jgi:tetratricopeptide (TPR) repeat protein
MKAFANRYNEKANELKDAGQIAEAIVYYKKAIQAEPNWATPWYNLGLLYKYEHNWAESFRCNRRAVELDPHDEASIWNLGIAATALNKWTEARRAWKSYGISIPEGEGPIEGNFGITPVRLNPDDGAEVVWCRRVDPARAIIDSIPFPESGHRYGDLILHDGAPNGFRLLQDREVPVFDELELLLPSEFGTFAVTLDHASTEELEELTKTFIEKGMSAENWATNTRALCRACSEGRPFDSSHQHDEAEMEPLPESNSRLAVAATSGEQINELLLAWSAQLPHVEIIELECLLEPAKAN